MEEPAKKRRRIVVGAVSPNRSSILVHKINKQAKWDLPDSHIHWGVGKKLKAEPFLTACSLFSDATIGIMGDTKHIYHRYSGIKSARKILPTGGFLYIFEDAKNLESLKDLEYLESLDGYVCAMNNVKKHLGLKQFNTELHSIHDIKDEKAHLKYGSVTIEAIRSFF